MNTRIASFALIGCLGCGTAFAQYRPATKPPASRMPAAPATSTPSQAATRAAQVYAANALPEPLKENEIKPMAIALPDDPLEPYLLTKENGPFMVLAQVFRGPDSERMALALCKELREEYGLPAYILRSKEFPMKSYIRGVPVQAPSETRRAAIKQPEQIRIHDEAAVLVGNEKTEQGTEELLHKVKKITPKCLAGMPRIFPWRQNNLGRALRTTNPYVPAQLLFPRAPDQLVIQMNSGRRSIANCPGHFTIQVANFTGHSGYAIDRASESAVAKFLDSHKSPLKTAHDDAELLAESLSKMPEIKQLGLPVYVYHDRTSSRVYVGAFNSTDDPNALAVHERLLRIAGQHNVTRTDRRGRPIPVDSMIVPATLLTNVDDLKATLK